MARNMMITVVLMAGSVAAAVASPQVDYAASPTIPLASLVVEFAPLVAADNACKLTAPYRRLHDAHLKIEPACDPKSST